MRRRFVTPAAALVLALAAACAGGTAPKPARDAATIADRIRATTLAIDGARLVAADDEPGNWLTHGRTYDEQRYSPLDQINDAQRRPARPRLVARPRHRIAAVEATPIVVDGVLYTTGAWSIVYALDARTGKLLWTLRSAGAAATAARSACCDVVNRGVARLERQGLSSARSTAA